MSALGQKQTLAHVRVMSALPPESGHRASELLGPGFRAQTAKRASRNDWTSAARRAAMLHRYTGELGHGLIIAARRGLRVRNYVLLNISGCAN
jgi:hypothetical protein